MRDFRTIGEVDLEQLGRALVRVGRYPKSGQLAITLIDADTLEPIATLSTNLAAYDTPIAADAAGIKTGGENASIIAPLLASGLFKDTGERVAGIPVWQLTHSEHVPPVSPAGSRVR